MASAYSGGVAVITGAAGGIGRGVANAAASRGMNLVLADIATAPLEEFVKQLSAAGTQAIAVPTDVADDKAVEALADKAYARFGAVDLLVNNAGIETLGNAWEISAEIWERSMRINVLGVVNGVRAFTPRLIAAKRPAHIVNLASIGGVSMTAGSAPYIMSKHAVLSLSECLYLELGRVAPEIRVSAVCPGPVATRIFADAPGGSEPGIVDRQRAVMHDMLHNHGISSDAAGVMIINQAEAGNFWIATHPEMLADAIARRAQYLTGQEKPFMSDEGYRMLGDRG